MPYLEQQNGSPDKVLRIILLLLRVIIVSVFMLVICTPSLLTHGAFKVIWAVVYDQSVIICIMIRKIKSVINFNVNISTFRCG